MIESCGDLSATDVAHTALDLVRVLPPAFGLAVIDRALQTCTPVDLAQLATAQSSKRGIRLLRWAIAHADARSESVGESVSRAVIHWLGFEAPDLQVELRSEGFVDRVNFAWRGARVIGELDGYGKYDAGDPGTTKARLIAEKVREDRLRRGRASFVRWDWAAMMQAAPLGDRLREAGVARAGPPQPAMLATLARNPRSYAYASGG